MPRQCSSLVRSWTDSSLNGPSAGLPAGVPLCGETPAGLQPGGDAAPPLVSRTLAARLLHLKLGGGWEGFSPLREEHVEEEVSQAEEKEVALER